MARFSPCQLLTLPLLTLPLLSAPLPLEKWRAMVRFQIALLSPEKEQKGKREEAQKQKQKRRSRREVNIMNIPLIHLELVNLKLGNFCEP